VIGVGSTFTPNDPVAVILLAVAVVTVAVALVYANHHTRDRF
jgi:cell division protein FtsL